MTKIDIFSGFLGAGKTTLIKKLIKEAYAGEKLVLIENEFGEIGIDGGFLKDSGVQINEMNSGCICCSLVGDFGEALKQVLTDYAPDRILIEPSGVGKLSDVIRAVQNIDSHDIVLNSFTTIVNAKKCKMYMKNFGEFFNDQVEHAGCIVFSHTDDLSSEKIDSATKLIREHNDKATVVTTPWDSLDGKRIAEAMENKASLSDELTALLHEHDEHHHHDHDEHCDCHDHDHHDHDHDHEHHHHDHDHDEHCDCHDRDHDHEHDHDHDHHHHHDHDHDEHCDCHDHDHHHHHHADEVFTSWGVETSKKFTAEEITKALKELENEEKYGVILRAKGIVEGADGSWIHYDYIPGESDVRTGSADIIGRLCVIGSNINEDAIKELFNV